jgi:hypothetical protein
MRGIEMERTWSCVPFGGVMAVKSSAKFWLVLMSFDIQSCCFQDVLVVRSDCVDMRAIGGALDPAQAAQILIPIREQCRE